MYAARGHASPKVKVEPPNRGPTRAPKNSHPPDPNPIWHRLATRTTPQGLHLQAKLKVGAPEDEHEREADRVADQVTRMSAPATDTPIIQRLCPECEEEMQRQPAEEEEEEEEFIQTRRTPGSTLAASPRAEAQIKSLRRGGQPLPEPVRAYFEPRFGQDFSHVRIHADSRAAESARAVNAKAFTVGRDVVFGSGEYAPDKASGQQLLAHELTHVVQQGRRNDQSRGPFWPNRPSPAAQSRFSSSARDTAPVPPGFVWRQVEQTGEELVEQPGELLDKARRGARRAGETVGELIEKARRAAGQAGETAEWLAGEASEEASRWRNAGAGAVTRMDFNGFELRLTGAISYSTPAVSGLRAHNPKAGGATGQGPSTRR